MDPITTAIVTAVGTGLVKDVVTDSYNALKAALKKNLVIKVTLLTQLSN
ncbi:MAG: hypothetical protein V7K88_25990 [Nostoc sp.]